MKTLPTQIDEILEPLTDSDKVIALKWATIKALDGYGEFLDLLQHEVAILGG